jgi:hypothetical protein
MGDVKTWVSTDGNWNTAGSWSPSGVPVATDDVYFVSGSQSVTTGASSSVVLNSLNFGTKWTGDTVVLTTSATTVDYANKVGTVILEGTYTTVNVQATASDNPALKFDTSTITTLRITGGSGTIYIDENSTVSGAINMVGCKGARLEIQTGATVSAADITIDAGKVLTYEQIDTLTQFGGIVTFANSDGTTNTVTLYKGIIKYKPTSTAVLTTLVAYGGYFDMRGCNSPSHTITDATIYSGSMIDERNGLSNCTFTNPILSNGGVFMPDLGRNITVT